MSLGQQRCLLLRSIPPNGNPSGIEDNKSMTFRKKLNSENIVNGLQCSSSVLIYLQKTIIYTLTFWMSLGVLANLFTLKTS